MSDEFWIENAAKLAEKGNAQLKCVASPPSLLLITDPTPR